MTTSPKAEQRHDRQITRRGVAHAERGTPSDGTALVLNVENLGRLLRRYPGDV
jgi:hypothetical protein